MEDCVREDIGRILVRVHQLEGNTVKTIQVTGDFPDEELLS